MRDPILVLNAGSSSIKFSFYETASDGTLAALAHGQVEAIGNGARLEVADAAGKKLASAPLAINDHTGGIAAIQDWFAAHVGSEASLAGIGHRVVHGGTAYTAPVMIDAAVIGQLEALIPLAPLHQPHHLAAIRAVSAIAPRVPQVACFDTAFHASEAPAAQAYALPRALTEKGIRRYGFHGLSYEYIVSILPEVAPDCVGRKLVIAHLGNGASMCAIENGRSVATTMGFTALEGLVMGTRSGSLDPGVLLYLLQQEHMDAKTIEQLLYQHSGLLGVSGISSDMRSLLASERPSAREAIELFVYRIRRELGSLVAALGGLDALIFTAGIGENAAEIRARVCTDGAWVGIVLDPAANAKHGPRISHDGSRVAAWVIPTNENLVIARHTRRLLDPHALEA
ncbi:MAG TPA: acetate/propionate family kinase [Stellaceae bacterium]|jgi:acetate kinase|nr:acetate/propionate family kinase [Stellaceae bacterium]